MLVRFYSLKFSIRLSVFTQWDFSSLTRPWAKLRAENCAIRCSNFFIFHELIENFCVDTGNLWKCLTAIIRKLRQGPKVALYWIGLLRIVVSYDSQRLPHIICKKWSLLSHWNLWSGRSIKEGNFTKPFGHKRTRIL